MLNPRLAGRYAKSLIDLSAERNQLDEVYADMQYLKAVFKVSKEAVNLLKSPVIPIEKKNKALKAVTAGKISDLTTSFNELLISKNREFYLPEIVNAFVDQYNKIKDIHVVKLTTAAPINEKVKSELLSKLKEEANLPNIELETEVKEEIIGGFVLEYNNNLVDASIERELRLLKSQFETNVYQQNIR